MLDRPDDLRNLALVGNGAKRAVHEAHTTAHALLVVDVGTAMLVGADGAHATGRGTGPHVMVDGLIRAGALAHATVDAGVLVYVGPFVHKRDGLLGTHLAAGVRETALAHVGDLVHVVLAGIAGELDDVDERWLVVRHVVDLRVVEAVRDALRPIHALQRQAHGQANALADDGTLQEDALAVGGDVARKDLEGQLVEGIVDVGIGHGRVLARLVADLRYLAKHIATDFRKVGVDPPHGARHGACPLTCTGQQAPRHFPSPHYGPTPRAWRGRKWGRHRARGARRPHPHPVPRQNAA